MSVFLIDKNFQKPYNRKTKNNVFEIDKILLQLDFGMVAKIICSFPAVALITCMILSIYFNSKETFSNDCSGLAKNFIPTISGAIGVAPQSYIWKIAIAMHSGVRFLIIPLVYRLPKHYTNVKTNPIIIYMINISVVCYFIENFTLVCVSIIGNKDNFYLHEKLFITFIVNSLFYQLLTIIIYKNIQERQNKSFPSYSLRIQLFIVNLILVVFIAFFMTIHRRYCAHYALSFFSLCECFLCFSIIGYHYLICYDIQKYDIMIGHPKRKII